jgi:hypothetical protein
VRSLRWVCVPKATQLQETYPKADTCMKAKPSARDPVKATIDVLRHSDTTSGRVSNIQFPWESVSRKRKTLATSGSSGQDLLRSFFSESL